MIFYVNKKKLTKLTVTAKASRGCAVLWDLGKFIDFYCDCDMLTIPKWWTCQRIWSGRIWHLRRDGSRPFLGGLQPPYLSSQPPKTTSSYLNDQASAASSRKCIILARLSISIWYSHAVIDRYCTRTHFNEVHTH